MEKFSTNKVEQSQTCNLLLYNVPVEDISNSGDKTLTAHSPIYFDILIYISILHDHELMEMDLHSSDSMLNFYTKPLRTNRCSSFLF